MHLTEVMSVRGHEQVVFVADAPTGLRATIAVHSTALGPSLGGIRFWTYRSDDDALADVLRLSEAMTLKAAVAGLHQGGGKAVVMVRDPDEPRSEALLAVLGRAIDELGGRYLAAEDVGATPRDMDLLARQTPWVTGVSESAGGSGDPSPVTAVGVVAGMRAACEAAFGTAELAARHVVVQGAGHVGRHVVRLLVDAGAVVSVSDLRLDKARAVAAATGARVVAPADAVTAECDVLAPCALGGVLTAPIVAELRCAVVCGAANNQLAAGEEAAVDAALAERGIVYAPDFVVNAGGIINIAEEFVGYDRNRALARANGIEDVTRRVVADARTQGIGTAAAAERVARRRLALEGRGRWRPGSPTAWTNGAPLTTLRPGAPGAAQR